jgi:hypothetical protein
MTCWLPSTDIKLVTSPGAKRSETARILSMLELPDTVPLNTSAPLAARISTFSSGMISNSRALRPSMSGETTRSRTAMSFFSRP